MLEKIKQAVIGGEHGYHHIIYTDVTLKDVVSDIIEVNTNDNLILYIDDFGLPEDMTKLNNIQLQRLANEYLYLSIYESTLSTLEKDADISLLRDILADGIEASTAEKLKDLIKKSKKIINNIYLGKLPINKSIPVSVFDDYFGIENLLELCNKKRMTVVLDNIETINLYSKVAVNDLIGARITKYLTCILSTPKEKWRCYSTSNFEQIQYIHDYLVVEDEEEKVYKKERYYGKQSNN